MGLFNKLKDSIKEQVSQAQEIATENKVTRKADLDFRKSLLQQFKPNEKVIGHLDVDKTNKIFKLSGLTHMPHTFSELLDFELQQNGSTITSGGLGRAVTFGVLTGGFGAVVGGVTGRKSKEMVNELKIKINITSEVETTVEYITLISKPVKSNSKDVGKASKIADQVLALLQYISDNQKNSVPTSFSTKSVTDNLREYKSLLDDGIITQEEFDKKKSELLE